MNVSGRKICTWYDHDMTVNGCTICTIWLVMAATMCTRWLLMAAKYVQDNVNVQDNCQWLWDMYKMTVNGCEICTKWLLVAVRYVQDDC